MVDGVEFTQLGEETPVRDIRPGKNKFNPFPDWKDKILSPPQVSKVNQVSGSGSGFNQVSVSGFNQVRTAKVTHQNRKKSRHVLKC
jgi:hypothetical protein